MISIAVIMTVHNRKDKTLKCLNHLFSSHFSDNVKIVVYMTDDGSDDGTAEMVQKQFEQVRIIKGDGTLFWNRGMYTAWKEAAKSAHDYYFWLNDDTFIFPDAIERLIAVSIKNEDKAIVVGSTCSVDNKDVITYGGTGKNGKRIYSETQELSCFYMNGNIVLIPDYVFKKVGFNDYHYRHALGDHDYGLMAIDRGIKVLVAPGIYGSCNAHDKKSVWCDSNQPFNKRWRNFFKPTGSNPFEFFYFRKKHCGLIPACLTFISNIIHVFFPRLWKEKIES